MVTSVQYSYVIHNMNFGQEIPKEYKSHIVQEMKYFSKVGWFERQNGSFGEIYSAPFAEVLTLRGFGFSFNLMDFDDLLTPE